VLNRELDVWRPFVLDANDREHSMTLYAKLKPDITLDAARAQRTGCVQGDEAGLDSLRDRDSVKGRPEGRPLQRVGAGL
jgi:hypothetical protein